MGLFNEYIAMGNVRFIISHCGKKFSLVLRKKVNFL